MNEQTSTFGSIEVGTVFCDPIGFDIFVKSSAAEALMVSDPDLPTFDFPGGECVGMYPFPQDPEARIKQIQAELEARYAARGEADDENSHAMRLELRLIRNVCKAREDIRIEMM